MRGVRVTSARTSCQTPDNRAIDKLQLFSNLPQWKIALQPQNGDGEDPSAGARPCSISTCLLSLYDALLANAPSRRTPAQTQRKSGDDTIYPSQRTHGLGLARLRDRLRLTGTRSILQRNGSKASMPAIWL